MKNIRISASQSTAHNFKEFSPTFEELEDLVSKKSANFCTHQFIDGHRIGTNVIEGFNLVVLDSDTNGTIKQAQEHFKDLKHIIYTTRSHKVIKDKNPLALDRFRVILPLDTTLKLSKEAYAAMMVHYIKTLPFEVDEAACKDIVRFWYTNKGAEVYSYKEGEYLKMESFLGSEVSTPTLANELAIVPSDKPVPFHSAIKQFSGDEEISQGAINTILAKKIENKNISEYTNGSGRNNCIFKTAAKLGANYTIDQQTFTIVLTKLNSLFATPLSSSELRETVLSTQSYWVEPSVRDKTSTGISYVDVHKQNWKVVRDDDTNEYVFLNLTTNAQGARTKSKGRVLTILAESDTNPERVAKPMNSGDIDEFRQLIESFYLRHTPAMPHGINKQYFNTFRPSKALNVIRDPESYASEYKYPTNILNYFKSFIPNEPDRLNLFGFLLRKLTTFEHSPVVLYFEGVRGSGKGIFIKILKAILRGSTSAPKPEVFFDKYNDWLFDAVFTFLDEYADKVTDPRLKKRLLGDIKDIAGNDTFQLRPFNGRTKEDVPNQTTLVLTSNFNTFAVKEDDRNVLCFETPNKIIDNENIGIQEAGGIGAFSKKVYSEVTDFCYFLVTECKMITDNEYADPMLLTQSVRAKYVRESMPAGEVIADYLIKANYAGLIELADEYEIQDFTENWSNGRLMTENLKKLLQALPKSETLQKLGANLKKVGFVEKQRCRETLIPGVRSSFYFYPIKELSEYVEPSPLSIVPNTVLEDNLLELTGA